MRLEDIELKTDFFELDEKFYERVDISSLKNARLISCNKELFRNLGIDEKECQNEDFVKIINGEKLLKGSKTFASVYAGHQFGHFVPQLGDGRAINLGKFKNYHLQTKGSGRTRYSRFGDGKAVLRSSIREYLISEAMHGLNIPTTRALGIIASDTYAIREHKDEPCSIVLRASSSWIRVGTFEFLARTKDYKENVEKMANYLINESFEELKNEENKELAYQKMFFELVDKSAKLLSLWQAYGFCHGVLNTDNFSAAGLTIDYGPFAFMNYFDENYICNHTDYEGRYSYKNQPYIARWNLLVLANALGCICNEDALKDYMKNFLSLYFKNYYELMSQKLGLEAIKSADSNKSLIDNLLLAMQNAKIDYSYFFYALTNLKSFDKLDIILDNTINKEPLLKWFELYKKTCEEQNSSFESRFEISKKVNPKYILKNYILQEAIEKAQNDDFSLVDDLLKIAQNPFDEHEEFERYALPTPLEFSNLQLSCSS